MLIRDEPSVQRIRASVGLLGRAVAASADTSPEMSNYLHAASTAIVRLESEPEVRELVLGCLHFPDRVAFFPELDAYDGRGVPALLRPVLQAIDGLRDAARRVLDTDGFSAEILSDPLNVERRIGAHQISLLHHGGLCVDGAAFLNSAVAPESVVERGARLELRTRAGQDIEVDLDRRSYRVVLSGAQAVAVRVDTQGRRSTEVAQSPWVQLSVRWKPE